MLRLGHLRPARMWVLLLLPLGSCTIQGVDGPPGLGEEGAPCSPSNRFACTEDGTAELVCREGWFVLSRLCDEPGCRVEELNGIPGYSVVRSKPMQPFSRRLVTRPWTFQIPL